MAMILGTYAQTKSKGFLRATESTGYIPEWVVVFLKDNCIVIDVFDDNDVFVNY